MADLTIEQIEEALRATGGFISQAADKLGVTQSAISKRVKRSPELKETLDEIVETKLDFTESKLMGLIEESHPASIYFYLKCKGKHRGYVERNEYTGKDGESLNLGVVALPPKQE